MEESFFFVILREGNGEVTTGLMTLYSQLFVLVLCQDLVIRLQAVPVRNTHISPLSGSFSALQLI